MPVIQSAIKKLRQNAKKAKNNRDRKDGLKKALDSYKKKPAAKSLSTVFSQLDKAAKTGLINKSKAARLKSRLSKKVGSK